MKTPNDVSLTRVKVLDSEMAYREVGSADAPAVLLLHGNPTSSYIWRNIIPHIAPVGHCIAVDLVGFGQSGKPRVDYRFSDHVRYLDAFLEVLGLESAYIVAQDWGTALAFHLAARRPAFVRGLTFMEFIRPFPDLGAFHQVPAAREAFRKFRTPGEGEQLIMEQNVFIERILPGSIMRELSAEELDVYRAPFLVPASRLPVWRLPNELPIGGEPADVDAALRTAHTALASSRYPKLLFAGDPGALVSPDHASQFASTLHDCKLVQLGPGRHYLQEDHPESIGRFTAAWISEIEARRDRVAA